MSAQKYWLIEDTTLLLLLMETAGAPLYTTKSSEPSESLAFYRAKAVSSFLSIGPIPGFKTHDLQALKSNALPIELSSRG